MKWFKQNKRMVYLIPSFFFPLSLTIYGFFMALSESVRNSFGFTLRNYMQLFKSPVFWDSFLYSIKITLISTCFSIVIGLWLTRFLYHYFRKSHWKIFVWIPLVFPHFVWGYMMILLFSQTGGISTLFYKWNIISDFTQFPILIKDEFGIGIILTYVWKEIPFVILMLLPVYTQLNERLSDVVKTLGGNEWSVFKTVEWPWLAPVIFEIGIIIFSFVLSAFEVPYLLGTTYSKMISVLSYEWFYEGDWSNRPLAFASMIVVTLTILCVVIIFFLLFNQKRFRMMKGNVK